MSERVEKREFVRRVRESWESWERQVARCPVGRMELPGFYRERSLRDVIMHITWYERQMVGILESRSFEGSPLWELPTDERNGIIYGENENRALDDVRGESTRVHARMMELMDGLADDELNDPASFPGMPAEWAPWDVIASNTYEHYDGHAESMETWLEPQAETPSGASAADSGRSGNEPGLKELITGTVRSVVADGRTVTAYRPPLVGFADATDPRFGDLSGHVGSCEMLPEDLLPGARTVVSFFLPFGEEVVEANRQRKSRVASEWAVAYIETNALIGRVCGALAEVLGEHGFRAAAEPATGKFDRKTLKSCWSHKSAAVIAGLGTFGLHHMVITEAGCAGRLGSLVTDAAISPEPRSVRQYCAHLRGETCQDCVARCPIGALNGEGAIDTAICWVRCTAVADRIGGDERAEVCGKCAVGPCAMESPRSRD
ncbi:MAG: ClbS/DfsB family four-helix bundle protein [Candidatus Eisenbacteria bacterium]